MGSGFGDLLRDYRLAAGLTQEGLAARAGLSVDAIGLLERGLRRAPRMSTVTLLADAMSLSQAERDALRQAARRGSARRGASLQVPPELLVPATSLVGRDEAVARAVALLRRPDVRLLTLTGPPGVGKTRLALETANGVVDEYEHGVVPVALAPVTSADLVAAALRRSLGLREDGGRPALERVLEHCRDRQLLLVLDNFEHLLAAAPVVVELLGRCPDVRVLVTSRASLRIRGEHELPVPPLDDEPAAALFEARARAASPGFQLSEANRAAVAAICQRLDGLPLALELAAPWVKVLTPESMLQRLDQRLAILVTSALDLPERQRTMRATLEWSCRLLTSAQRALLRRLSVFAGSAPLDGIEPVCQAAGPLPEGTLDALAALVDHSLVRRQEAPPGETRLTMLETVREYGRELLQAAGEEDATVRAHAEHYAALTATADEELRGERQGAWMRRLDLELDNVGAALAWTVDRDEVELGLRIATQLRRFWDRRGLRREGLDWLERLLATAGDAPPALRAEALGSAATLAWMVGDFDLSRRRGEESLAISRDLGDPRGMAFALRGLGQLATAVGDDGRALTLYEQAESLLREVDDPHELANVLMHIGNCLANLGEPRQAIRYQEEALAMRRELGDRLGVALSLTNLAEVVRREGDGARARAWLEEAVSIGRELGAPFQIAAASGTLGDLARQDDDPAAACRYYEESLRLFVQIAYEEGIAFCLERLAWAAWRQGDALAAARLHGVVATLQAPETPDPRDRAQLDDARAAARTELGARYEAAFAAGRRLTPDDVLADLE